MKTKENQFFKAIDFEAVFDTCLDECEKTIDCVKSIKVDGVEYGVEYGVEIVGNLITGLTKVEVFIEEDGKNIDIDHATLLRWGDVELDKYLERNKEAVMKTFPYQFEPQPTDGVRIL